MFYTLVALFENAILASASNQNNLLLILTVKLENKIVYLKKGIINVSELYVLFPNVNFLLYTSIVNFATAKLF